MRKKKLFVKTPAQKLRYPRKRISRTTEPNLYSSLKDGVIKRMREISILTCNRRTSNLLKGQLGRTIINNLQAVLSYDTARHDTLLMTHVSQAPVSGQNTHRKL